MADLYTVEHTLGVLLTQGHLLSAPQGPDALVRGVRARVLARMDHDLDLLTLDDDLERGHASDIGAMIQCRFRRRETPSDGTVRGVLNRLMDNAVALHHSDDEDHRVIVEYELAFVAGDHPPTSTLTVSRTFGDPEFISYTY